MRKLITVILCAAMLAGVLAGCQPTSAPSGSTSTSASQSASAENVEITFWTMPMYDDYGPLIQEDYPAAVKAAYPNITVKTEILSWDAGPEKITVAMATGGTPDILNDVYSRLAPGPNAGLCVDLTELATTLKDIFLEGYLETGIFDGKNYYLPDKSNNGYNMTVNMSLVKKYKLESLLPADKTHWSYDQFLKFSREAYKAGKADGLFATQLWAGSRSSDAVYYSLLMCGGTDILNKEHTKLAANTATAKATLAVLKTLVDEGMIPEGAATTKDESVDPNFYSGKLFYILDCAGAQTPVTIYNKVKAGEMEDFEAVTYQYPTPDGKADPRVASFGTNGFVVFTNGNDANKIDAAKKAIDVYFRDDNIIAETCLKTGLSPTTSNITLDYGDDVLNAKAKEAVEANAKYATSGFGILEPWWSDFRETYYVQLQAYYTGTKTVDQALADWETTANDVISKALAK